MKLEKMQKFLMKYSSFVVTSIISIIFGLSMSPTPSGKYIMATLMFILQWSLVLFYKKGKDINFPAKERKSYLRFARWLFGISVLCTVAFSYNSINELFNKSVIESDKYQKVKQLEDGNKKIIEKLEDKYESSKTQDFSAQLKSYDIEIDKLNKEIKYWESLETSKLSYEGQISRVLGLIATQEQKKSEKENQLSMSLSDSQNATLDNLQSLYTKDYSKDLDLSSIELESTSGFVSLCMLFGEWFKVVAFIISVALGVSLDMCTVKHFQLDLHSSSNETIQNVVNAEVKEVKPNPTKFKLSKPAIGFKSDIPSESDIKKYMSSMANPKQDGYCRGYKTMSNITGFKQEDCRTIKGILERRGIVKTIGTKTKIIG